jgi:hypothetical protein
MKNTTRENIIVAAVLIICPIALAWSYYTYCDFKAERYNENLGTNYSAVDIMLGVEKTARDSR